MVNRRIIFYALAALISVSCVPSKTIDGPRHFHNAEVFTEQGKFDEAIAEYHKHIEYRLAVPDRPEWENPWFYLLKIGDLQLQKNDVAGALASYEEAEKKGVDRSLVADRYRHAANFLAERGRLAEALQILTTYRDRDPLLIDAMRDRIAREIIEKEDTR